MDLLSAFPCIVCICTYIYIYTHAINLNVIRSTDNRERERDKKEHNSTILAKERGCLVVVVVVVGVLVDSSVIVRTKDVVGVRFEAMITATYHH